MFDRQYERSTDYETPENLLAHEVEAFDVVQGQRTDHHLERVGRKVDVLDPGTAILNPSIIGGRLGACEHFLR